MIQISNVLRFPSTQGTQATVSQCVHAAIDQTSDNDIFRLQSRIDFFAFKNFSSFDPLVFNHLNVFFANNLPKVFTQPSSATNETLNNRQFFRNIKNFNLPKVRVNN